MWGLYASHLTSIPVFRMVTARSTAASNRSFDSTRKLRMYSTAWRWKAWGWAPVHFLMSSQRYRSPSYSGTIGIFASLAHSFSIATHGESKVYGSMIVTSMVELRTASSSAATEISWRLDRSNQALYPAPSTTSATQMARSSARTLR